MRMREPHIKTLSSLMFVDMDELQAAYSRESKTNERKVKLFRLLGKTNDRNTIGKLQVNMCL